MPPRDRIQVIAVVRVSRPRHYLPYCRSGPDVPGRSSMPLWRTTISRARASTYHAWPVAPGGATSHDFTMEARLRRYPRGRCIPIRSECGWWLYLPCLMLLFCAAPLLAQETGADSASARDSSSAATASGWDLGPPGQVYPLYLADPRRPKTNVGVLHVLRAT